MPIDFIADEVEAPKIDFVPDEPAATTIDFVPDPVETPSLRPTIPEPGEEMPLIRGITPDMPQAYPAKEAQAQANIESNTPELTGAEVEQMLMTPQVTLPNPVPESMPITRGAVNVLKAIPESVTAPGTPLIAVAQLVPGVREAVDAVLGASMVKAGAQVAGEASVTGDKQQMTEGVLTGVLGAATLAAPHIAPIAATELAARRVGKPDLAAVDVAVKQGMEPTPLAEIVAPKASEALKATTEALKTTTEVTAKGEENAIPQREAAPVPVEEPARPSEEVGAQVREQAATVEAPKEEVVPAPAEPKIEGMGGAVPSEFEPTSSTPSGIKNATVERERAARGLPPAVEPARRSFGRVWDEAMAKIDQDPAIQDKLIAELNEKPRALTDTEDALLLQRQIDLQNEYGKATRDLAQAYDDGRLADVEVQRARVGEMSNKLFELYEIDKKAGTETGRGLAARKMMANEDFTLAKMEMDARAAKGGKPLSDAERSEMVRIQTEFERINKELEAKVADKERLLSEAQMARTMAEMRAAQAKEANRIPPAIKRIVDRVRVEIKKGADESRKYLAGAQFTLSPEVLYHLSRVGADNLLEIGESGARWASKMIADIGERVRPYLDEILAASEKLVDNTADRLSGKVKAAVQQTVRQTVREPKTPQVKAEIAEKKIRERVEAGDMAIRPMVQRLARALVESGIKEREVLIDKVHEILVDIVPEWTRRDTMDAISGYGEIKLLRKDEVSLKLRDLKGQMQQLGKLEDMAAKQAPKKTGLERRIPSDAEKELIKKVNEAKRKGGYTTADPERELRSALEELKARMTTDIKELERRLREKDFSKPTKLELDLDKEAVDLQFRREQIKRKWHEELFNKRMAERTTVQKGLALIPEILNTWRAIRTSADFSALLRQGKFIAISHPILTAKAVPSMFKAFASERRAFAIDKQILERKNYPLYKRSGLFLSEHGVSLSKMEEVYMARWAQKLPLVAGSGRAYSTFLNRLRADAFDSLVNSLGRNGTVTDAEANVLANYINVATGRGSLGKANAAAAGLNTAFFAPRFVASRFQMALGQPLLYGIKSGKAHFLEAARARKVIAQEYAKILAGYATIYTLGALAGAKISFNSNSSDFGKFIVGDTRIDPLAGVSQATVLLSRLVTGEKTSLKGKTVPIRGKLPYGAEDVTDVLKNFARSKLSPVIGTALDLLSGSDVTGQPVSTEPTDLLLKYVAPISLQDIADAMEEHGVPKGVALTILSMFGESVQTYEDRKKR